MRVIPDTPLSDIKADRLGREPMVELIVESINQLTSTNHPCTVYGIYGKWGEGKTSLMNFIKGKLLAQGEEDGINLVEFNPWLVNNDEALLREFFKTIISCPDDTVKEALKKYGSLAVFASKTIVNAIVPGVGSLLAERIGMAKSAVDDAEESLSDLKKKVSQAIVKSKRHLVVMIDDVDRLDKEEVHAVLRMIRQVADFDNCIYIVAIDPAMVAKSIGPYHGKGSSEDGRKFLNKIVQVPITLPQIPDGLLRDLIREELTSTLSGYVAGKELESIATSVTPFISTYRDLKRYCNQISFVLPHLKDEVNIKDLCLLECIKIVNAESYRKIIEKRSSLMHKVSDFALYVDKDKELENIEKRYAEAKNVICQGNDGKVKNILDKAIDELFEKVSFEYQDDLDEKRLRTDVYFPKYFTLSVPSELIPDRELDSFNTKYRNMSIEEIAQQFDCWADNHSASEVKRAVLYLIHKIADAGGQCEPASVMAQSISVCKLAKGLPPHVESSQEVVSSFVPIIVIYRHMFVQDENYATMKVIDADLLDKTITYIFSNADLNYCLNFLCSAYDIFRNSTYNGNNALKVLIQRFKALDIETQFGYSRFLLQTLLGYWKDVDARTFDEYASNLFMNPDISCKMVFDKFLDNSDEDIDNFVKLFKNQIPRISERLSTESEDVRNSESVKRYTSNLK